MFKKLMIGAVMAVALMVEMPFVASAATNVNNAAVTNPQIRVQIGRTRRDRNWRYRHYRHYRRYEQTGRYRLVPQYYWMNGRRYVRYVRVYNF